MIKFNKPEKLNGAQLIAELNAQNIKATQCLIDGNGEFFIDVPTKDIANAETIVSNHVGANIEPTLAQKLASVGLSIDELKAALA